MHALLTTIAGAVALVSSSVALAQSSVSVFGTIDTAITWSSNTSKDLRPITPSHPASVGSVTLDQTQMTSSRLAQSRIGFRGIENLGGGFSAGFWLEGNLMPDTGVATLFSSVSVVGLRSPYGELRLGRDYTPTFWNDSQFDPFGAMGAGSSLLIYMVGTGGRLGSINPFVSRASNSVGYHLPPNLGGVYGQVMYSFNEQTKFDPDTLAPGTANSRSAGKYFGGRIGYANKGLDVALAFSDLRSGDDPLAGWTDSVRQVSLGANYDLDFVKLFSSVTTYSFTRDYTRRPARPLSEIAPTGWLVGFHIPVGVGLIRFAYSRDKYSSEYTNPDPEASKIALGYIHNLSRRTALYGTVARVSNKNLDNATAAGTFYPFGVYTPTTSLATEMGIRHNF